jgi:signal transduction histidine kinase
MVMAILFSILGFTVYSLLESSSLRAIDNSLKSTAHTLSKKQFLRSQTNRQTNIEDFLFRRLGVQSVRLYAVHVDTKKSTPRIRTKNVRVKVDSSDRIISRARLGRSTWETFVTEEGLPHRQITVPIMHRGRFTEELVKIATPLTDHFVGLARLRTILYVSFPVALFLCILLGYVFTSLSFRSVREITKEASNINFDRMQARLPLPIAKDELYSLTNTFNDLLGRLEESIARQKRFTGDVSHELRTSLAVLRGEAQLALRRERDPQEYKDALVSILDESVHMSGIVEDLLLLSRAQSKSVAMSWERVDTPDFLLELESMVKPEFVSRGIKLTYEMDIPDHFFAAKNYLLLSLKNILINAAKHTKKQKEVVIRAVVEAERVRFAIKDFGEGIPEDSLPHIFESFFRADTARNRKEGGAGIGLSLAQALIGLHQGEITVESKVGVGSTFTVSIPQVPIVANTPEPAV